MSGMDLSNRCSEARFLQLGEGISQKKTQAKKQLHDATVKDAPGEMVKATPLKRRRVTMKAVEVGKDEAPAAPARQKVAASSTEPPAEPVEMA